MEYPKRYLSITAKHLIFHFFKDRAKTKPVEDIDVFGTQSGQLLVSDLTPTEEAALSSVEEYELGEVLEKMLEHLPPKQRRLVELSYLGLSYEEIVNITGIPIGSIGPTLMRARKRIGRTLAELRDSS